MDLNKKHKDIKADPKADKEVTNNNVFIGSTTDLQRLLHKEEKDVTPND
jgi:hypothetical protein